MWLSAIYCAVAIVLPLLSVFRGLVRATTPAHFHRLSSLVKVIMLTGILSLLFFKYYA
jgi:4-hydroxybenzoate polyprenyltransferase